MKPSEAGCVLVEACEKDASDSGDVVVFDQCSDFLHLLRQACHELVGKVRGKGDDKTNSNIQILKSGIVSNSQTRWR